MEVRILICENSIIYRTDQTKNNFCKFGDKMKTEQLGTQVDSRTIPFRKSSKCTINHMISIS